LPGGSSSRTVVMAPVATEREENTVRFVEQLTGGGPVRVRRSVGGLIVAGLVVAVAIAIGGAFGRSINGVGALVWMASTVVLLLALRGEPRWSLTLALATLVTLVLSFVVEPTDIETAVPGFAIGGAAIALIARRSVAWAFVVPALWLPVHLLTAVIPAIIRASSGGEASVRTDPPPTAAVVPLTMILSAGIAGWAINWLRNRRTTRRTVTAQEA